MFAARRGLDTAQQVDVGKGAGSEIRVKAGVFRCLGQQVFQMVAERGEDAEAVCAAGAFQAMHAAIQFVEDLAIGRRVFQCQNQVLEAIAALRQFIKKAFANAEQQCLQHGRIVGHCQTLSAAAART